MQAIRCLVAMKTPDEQRIGQEDEWKRKDRCGQRIGNVSVLELREHKVRCRRSDLLRRRAREKSPHSNPWHQQVMAKDACNDADEH